MPNLLSIKAKREAKISDKRKIQAKKLLIPQQKEGFITPSSLSLNQRVNIPLANLNQSQAYFTDASVSNTRTQT